MSRPGEWVKVRERGGGGPTPLTNYFELGKKREKRVKFFKFQIILCRTRTAHGKR